MPSPADFGFAEDPENPRRRRSRYVVTDESGARPLPTGYDSYEPYDADPLDDEVELPGVSRPQAGMFFGIGVGLGIAVLAIVAGLYLGGYVGRPMLGASPSMASLEPNPRPFEDWANIEALDRARMALASTALPPGVVESPDIRVIDETAAKSAPEESAPAPESSPTPSRSGTLTNELDELQRSIEKPRAPVAPRPLSNDVAPAEPVMPPPAKPTAPAETSAPDTIPPPQDQQPSPPQNQNPY